MWGRHFFDNFLINLKQTFVILYEKLKKQTRKILSLFFNKIHLKEKLLQKYVLFEHIYFCLCAHFKNFVS